MTNKLIGGTNSQTSGSKNESIREVTGSTTLLPTDSIVIISPTESGQIIDITLPETFEGTRIKFLLDFKGGSPQPLVFNPLFYDPTQIFEAQITILSTKVNIIGIRRWLDKVNVTYLGISNAKPVELYWHKGVWLLNSIFQ